LLQFVVTIKNKLHAKTIVSVFYYKCYYSQLFMCLASASNEKLSQYHNLNLNVTNVTGGLYLNVQNNKIQLS